MKQDEINKNYKLKEEYIEQIQNLILSFFSKLPEDFQQEGEFLSLQENILLYIVQIKKKNLYKKPDKELFLLADSLYNFFNLTSQYEKQHQENLKENIIERINLNIVQLQGLFNKVEKLDQFTNKKIVADLGSLSV